MTNHGTKSIKIQNLSSKKVIYVHNLFHVWGRVCVLYMEHLVPLPILDIIICLFLDYYILSMFHNMRSPLSYHTLIFDLMTTRNFYLYNSYIYTYFLLKIVGYSVSNVQIGFISSDLLRSSLFDITCFGSFR